MNPKSSFLAVAAILIVASGARAQSSAPPAARLRQAGAALQRQTIVSQRALEGLDQKIRKTRQGAPGVGPSLDWLSSAIARQKFIQRLKEAGAGLSAAQKGLSQFDGGCKGLTAAGWEPVIAADRQMARAIQDLRKIRADLVKLHNARLGETALRPLIRRLEGGDTGQALVLEALIKATQERLNSSASSLQKGLAATDLEKAGRLLEAHNAYCKVRVQPAAPQNFVGMSGGLVDSEKVEQGIEIVGTAKDMKSKIKEIKSLIKSTPMRTGALGQPVKGGNLFLQIFGEDIKDIVLAELGDSNAYARHIGRELDERLDGTLGNAYTHAGQGDLQVNDAGQVYDRDGNFVGTLDESGHVVPSERALRGYNPSFNWLVPKK
jgi:hypothetical protein